MIRTARNAPTSDGGYTLASYPGCTDLTTGDLATESSFVAGRNTEHERLFRRLDLAAATEYAILNKLELESIPNGGLCAAAVEALYSPA